jgi:nucleotide-binding universal stress UspA family protein
MKTTKNLVLVPTDFTKVGKVALNHAVKLSKELLAEVHLLHIIEKENEREDAIAQLETIKSAVKNDHNTNVEIHVKMGNIFDGIGEAARELNARMIIMGTHGVKGFQHITGSHAIKVITNSEVPFIVVQEKTNIESINNIVLPLSLSKETKHKLYTTIELAKYFDAQIHVIAPYETDELYAKTVNLNLAFTKNYLEENNISYTVKIATEKGSFEKQVNSYAEEINADLIAIVNSNSGFGFFVNGEEQEIITNEAHIPVLCVNPAQVTKAGGVIGS